VKGDEMRKPILGYALGVLVALSPILLLVDVGAIARALVDALIH
jgi:hypothetical protein